MQDEDDPTGTEVTLYRINVSFYLSRWTCQYGSCPGILVTGVNTDHGCCQYGVRVKPGKELKRMKEVLRTMTADDMDNIDQLPESLYRMTTEERAGNTDFSHHTTMKDGVCVFANRTGGPAGKPGCAFHHLANRLGVHPSETKPDICWRVPYQLDTSYDTTHSYQVVTVTANMGTNWGGFDTEYTEFVGYWCTETSDAYNGSQPVYVAAEIELRKMLGDRVYERMAEELSTMERRYPMPGEVANGGRPMLPLLVKERVDVWTAKGDTDALRRSEAYLREH